jgi:hypothetical protein
MAIWYVDPVNGNDANAGSSFALRKKTVTSAVTASATSDTIRVMKSADPTLVGNATWTTGSKTVTLGTAVTANVEMCESGWTASANVTATYVAGWEGTNAMNLAVAAGFTTGKLAYKTLASTDFSGYQQLSFTIQQTVGTLIAAGVITISLCSDTLGATPVNTFSVPLLGALSAAQSFTVDLATNLGTTIQSVAINRTSNTGAITFQIDNIIACKAASSADSLSLTSLISLNNGSTNEPWAPIRSINGTTVILDQDATQMASATGPNYYGTTTTASTYKRETSKIVIPTASSTNLFCAVAKAVTISGGWDTTAMSSQTGDTYFDGANSFGYGCAPSIAGVVFDKMNPVRFFYGLIASVATTFTAKDIIGCQTAGAALTGGTTTSFTVNSVSYNSTYGVLSNAALTSGTISVNYNVSNRVSGFSLSALASGVSVSLGTCVNNAGTSIFNGYKNSSLTFTSLYNTATTATDAALVDVGSSNGTAIGSPVINSTITIGSAVSATATSVLRLWATQGCTLDLTGATLTGVTYGITNQSAATSVDLTIKKGTLGNQLNAVPAGVYRFLGTTFTSTPTALVNGTRIQCQNYNATTDDHRVYCDNGSILTNTTTRHTASGISWAFSPTATATASYPLVLPVSKVAVGSGTLVTASLWMYRTNTGLTGTLTAKDPSGIVLASSTSSSMAGAANAWEQVTVTFTPSAAGVVEFEASCYGNTYTMYIDDFAVSQA